MRKIPNKEFCIENNVKPCNMCGRYLPLDSFGKKKRGFLGVKGRCKDCLSTQQKSYYFSTPEYKEYHKNYTNKWRNDNRARWREINLKNNASRRGQKIRRRTMKALLPCEFTNNELEDLFKGSSRRYEIDHFIPLSIGHGGTYKGNLMVIPKDWNTSKSNKNPFEWCKENLTREELDLYMGKVENLAKLNEMSLIEFEDYTNWCFKNPRTLTDLEVEIKTTGHVKNSVDLYRQKS